MLRTKEKRMQLTIFLLLLLATSCSAGGYYRYDSSHHSSNDGGTATAIIVGILIFVFFIFLIAAFVWWGWGWQDPYCGPSFFGGVPYYGYCSRYGAGYVCDVPGCTRPRTSKSSSKQYSYHDIESGEHEQYQEQRRENY